MATNDEQISKLSIIYKDALCKFASYFEANESNILSAEPSALDVEEALPLSVFRLKSGTAKNVNLFKLKFAQRASVFPLIFAIFTIWHFIVK